MFQNKDRLYPVLIAVAAAILYIPFLGGVHLFDWDEINFAESAREMIRTGDYLTVQINYFPFWEKPPLFIWMQVVSMKVFGINEFAARFPNAIGGIISLLVLYRIGNRLYNPDFGFLWALVYAGSILPHLYFKSGIIDPWFNLFIFLGIVYMIRYVERIEKRKKHTFTVLSAVFIGLAILTKGPVGLLIFALVIFFWLIFSKKWASIFNVSFISLYLLTLVLVGGFWFFLQIFNGQAYVIVDFFRYQIRLFTQEDAGHGGFLLYHFVVLLIGVFPASIFALPAFIKIKDQESPARNFRIWMHITFWVVLLLFTIVNTKIVHYSSMCYFPLTFLGTYIVYHIITGEKRFRLWLKITVASMAIFIGILPIMVQLFIRFKDRIIESGIIKDDFAVGNLQASVTWSGFEFLIGLILIFGVLGALIFIRKIQYQILVIFISSLLFVNLTILIIVPKVEAYSQNAALEFFKEISTEDCYVDTWGYKSYAHYFYFKKQPPGPERLDSKEILLKGPVDKKVYISVKNFKAEEFQNSYPLFRRLFEKNGFVFFARELEGNHTE